MVYLGQAVDGGHYTGEQTTQHMATEKKQHAVVIGGSMAGLAAARALANHFEHVTIVERDRFRSFRYEPPRRFRAWLKAVVGNDLCDFLRQRRHEVPGNVDRSSRACQALEQVADARLGEFSTAARRCPRPRSGGRRGGGAVGDREKQPLDHERARRDQDQIPSRASITV